MFWIKAYKRFRDGIQERDERIKMLEELIRRFAYSAPVLKEYTEHSRWVFGSLSPISFMTNYLDRLDAEAAAKMERDKIVKVIRELQNEDILKCPAPPPSGQTEYFRYSQAPMPGSQQ